MKKLLCVVLAMLMLLGAASAEVVTFQGLKFDLPAGVTTETKGDTITLTFNATSMVMVKTMDLEAMVGSVELIETLGEETVLALLAEEGFEKEGYPTEMIEIDGKPCLMVDMSKNLSADMKGKISDQLIAFFGPTAVLIQGVDFVNEPEDRAIEVLGMISVA